MSGLVYNQYNRGTTWDIGALEFGSTPSEAGASSPVCGNGVVEGTEQCDDGNTNNSDSCNTSCQIVTASPLNGVCGFANNSCTAGTLSDIADSSTSYLWSCTGSNGGTTASCSLLKPVLPVCGNGIKDGTEECDDDNLFNGDGCSNICTNEYCGNGKIEGFEQCDDGNTTSGDGCSSLCAKEVLPVCGNGTKEGTEECDDGNLVVGDSCSALCI